MKKFICILLIAVFAFAAVSCTEPGNTDTTTDAKSTKPAETEAAPNTAEAPSTSAVTEPKEVINVPDVTLTYVPADVFANKEAAEAAGYKTTTDMNLSLWFTGTITLDDQGSFAAPEAFSMIDSYVLRLPSGKHVMEIDVFKAADGADMSKIVSLAQDRYNVINGSDWRLYDSDGSNALIIDTIKIEQVGSFVVYALTNDSEVSILRAKKFVSENPDCTAVELYRAIVCDIVE